MPARATKTDTISHAQLYSLDALNLKLLCANGALAAIFATFDDESRVSSLAPDMLYDALFSVMTQVREAREIAGNIA